MLPIGTILRGIYRVERHIASGGFGYTYFVTNIGFKEVFAIKEFFMEGINDREADTKTVSVSNEANKHQYSEQLEKFKKEARRLRHLNNKHIVGVHDLFEENGTCYYVMDFIDGETLNERLKRLAAPLSENEVSGILTQVLDALDEVHNHNIWHLDLKPGNIMIDRSGTVRLIDFGASKQMSPDGGATATTSLCYTPGYAPPEQSEQNMDKFGPWTDIYALGATLFTLLTCQRPPMSSDISESPETAFAPLKSCSHKMQELVMWMMQPNRQDRPQNVAELNARIAGNVPNPFVKWLSKHIWWVAGAVVAMAAALYFILTPHKRRTTHDTDDEITLEQEVEEYRDFDELDDRLDTLTFAFGMAQTQGLNEYLGNTLGVDTTLVSELSQGMLQGAMLSDIQPEQMEANARAAYNAGIQIGGQISTSFLKGINSQVFGEDSTKSVSLETFMAGFIQGVFEDTHLMNHEEAQETAQRLLDELKKENMERQYADNKEAGEEFLEENAAKEDVVVLASGVQYKVLRSGNNNGQKPKEDSEVKLHYEGRFIDGKVFDSSYERDEPSVFKVNQVIAGFAEALLLMTPGDKWEVYIPQELAYGDREQGNIKPFSTLIFTIELININRY